MTSPAITYLTDRAAEARQRLTDLDGMKENDSFKFGYAREEALHLLALIEQAAILDAASMRAMA